MKASTRVFSAPEKQPSNQGKEVSKTRKDSRNCNLNLQCQHVDVNRNSNHRENVDIDENIFEIFQTTFNFVYFRKSPTSELSEQESRNLSKTSVVKKTKRLNLNPFV